MARSTTTDGKTTEPNAAQVQELLYQALETETGGALIYTEALQCARNPDLRKEWQEYLEQTRHHREVLLKVFEQLGLDPEARTPGREVVAHLGASLVEAMRKARSDADPAGAELVACECVVLAETKDHLNWELIGKVAEQGGPGADVLKEAYDQVEDQEDHHLYHTTGFTRELWLDALGLPAVLPPPEEIRKVETKMGAARAEQQRDQLM